MSDRPELTIAVPAYCEQQSLDANLLRIVEMARQASESVELIVVDDGSTDQTWQALLDLVEQIPELYAVRLSRNFGKEAAISAGLSLSSGAAVIVMDADLQHPPDLIPRMVRLWREEGFDIVNAVKAARGQETRSKSLLARLYYRLFSRLAGLDLQKASDFKLLDREVVEKLNDLPERRTFFRGLVAWMGYRQANVEFDVQARAGGESRWSLWTLTRLAIDSILAFSAMPMHLITVLGVVLALVSSVLGAQALWQWASGEAEPGFPTVILLIIFFSSILMIGLGIIGAYIAKIYDEVKRRPRFLIHDQAAGAAHRAPGAGRSRRAHASPARD